MKREKISPTLEALMNINQKIISNYNHESFKEDKIKYYAPNLPTESRPRIDYQSGARVEEVSPSQLGSDILGLYNWTTHHTLIANNLGWRELTYVPYHESGHAIGMLGPNAEQKADAWAAAHTGHMLRPLYSPEYSKGRAA